MNKLSVIIPFYNADSYIGDVLEDLLHQDMSTDEYEIIVVNDGSTENIDTLRSYCDNYSCIRYIPISHAGLSAARNVGLESAHGEYVFFCDSDDKVKRNVFGHLYEVAEKKDFTTFITLHNAFRYLSISQNWHILLELRDMGAYPIREQRHSNRFHRFIQWTMNHSALWMTCCVAFHVLPWRLRKKL